MQRAHVLEVPSQPFLANTHVPALIRLCRRVLGLWCWLLPTGQTRLTQRCYAQGGLTGCCWYHHLMQLRDRRSSRCTHARHPLRATWTCKCWQHALKGKRGCLTAAVQQLQAERSAFHFYVGPRSRQDLVVSQRQCHGRNCMQCLMHAGVTKSACSVQCNWRVGS